MALFSYPSPPRKELFLPYELFFFEGIPKINSGKKRKRYRYRSAATRGVAHLVKESTKESKKMEIVTSSKRNILHGGKFMLCTQLRRKR